MRPTVGLRRILQRTASKSSAAASTQPARRVRRKASSRAVSASQTKPESPRWVKKRMTPSSAGVRRACRAFRKVSSAFMKFPLSRFVLSTGYQKFVNKNRPSLKQSLSQFTFYAPALNRISQICCFHAALSQFSKIVPIKTASLRYAVCGCCLCIKNANCYNSCLAIKWLFLPESSLDKNPISHGQKHGGGALLPVKTNGPESDAS